MCSEIYTWFKMGGELLILRNGKIVDHDDFLNNYWELNALGLSCARILEYVSRDPKNEEERQIVKNVRSNSRIGDNDD